MTSPLLTEIDQIERNLESELVRMRLGSLQLPGDGKPRSSLERNLHELFALAQSLALPDEWFIWSNEHRAYWRPNSAGYVVDARGAGSYTLKEALEICRDENLGIPEGANPNEIVTPSTALATQWLALRAPAIPPMKETL